VTSTSDRIDLGSRQTSAPIAMAIAVAFACERVEIAPHGLVPISVKTAYPPERLTSGSVVNVLQEVDFINNEAPTTGG